MAKVAKSRTFTPAQVAKWRRELMRKGMDVNEKLTRLLGRQNATLATLKLPTDKQPAEPPELKLRRWLDQIIRAQRRLETPTWGRCQTCGKPMPLGALDDTPWIEHCATCERKA